MNSARSIRRGLATALAALALTACSTMPDERPLNPTLPANWTDAPAVAQQPVTDWWRQFNDPALVSLVDQALLEGPSVQQALLRVREARALSHSTVTQFLPELTATGQGQYQRAVEDGALPTAGGGVEREQMTGSYGAQVAWEIPLFSRIEAAFVGSRANTRAAVADVRAAQVALAADVAQAYVDLRAAQASRAALARSVETADELARILQISYEAGITSEADAADARRLAEATRTRLPGLVIEERRAENVLAVLRGLAPGTESADVRAVLDAQGRPIPVLNLTQAPAAPADLVRLRPDVARAEAQALVAAAGVANARNDLLPRLNLTGAVLTTDALIGDPVSAGATFATGTPLISIPLFDWGQRFARIRERDAQFDQALLQYRQVVTQAIAEGSNALVALDQGRLRLDSARRAETAAETTARGSRAAYGAGIQSLADRLRSEQQLIDANLTRIDAEAQAARAAIAIYRAFGGGPSFATPLRDVPSQ
ncbi:MAG TPA: efflux transporter outer membrane subunit [Vitreimonas sp.]|uniref:efflux transporter outer membrane subunit n=1 Tax=Vitreimonas sp. TaxID=3069702 RepID=UPI002D5DFD54|nr:efflux transporter outer membrane subunit [Vitreimonas sp.]HYD86226.1 efflux transporter outer membrane subunit [Vitreimonas sp.]